MENKEKQMIEKTIDILYDLNDTYKSLPREQLENAIKFGSYYDVVKLIKLGYRKINENEVVLTKEAYDKLCHLAYFGYDDAYEKGSQETAKDILNGIECFFWETAINDAKFFDLYQDLYRSIKEHIKNKYGIIQGE